MTTAFNFPRSTAPVSDAPEADVLASPQAPQAWPRIRRQPFKNFGKESLKRVLFALSALLLAAVAGVVGYRAYVSLSTHQETDDAYITGHLHQVSTRVNGTVAKVLVDDNEHVKKGQVLVLLDPNDFQAAADQAKADLEQAEKLEAVDRAIVDQTAKTALGQDTNAQGGISNATAEIAKNEAAVKEIEAGIESAKADLAAKEAEVERALGDYKRYSALAVERAVATQQVDNAKRDYIVAQQNRNAAQQALAQAVHKLEESKQAVKTAQAQLVQARGQVQLAAASASQINVADKQFRSTIPAVEKARQVLRQAELNLSYTKIVAPCDGRIGKKSVEEGDRIEPGQALMNIVSDDLWVVANFKETQLDKMRVGQPVELKIDSFPGHKFEGKVLSFSPGSGSSFAVLPSDNATGNFTKIVQRVPVKILFDSASVRDYKDLLAPGMSVVANVSLAVNGR